MEVKPWMEVTLYKSDSMWILSPYKRLVVSIVLLLGRIIIVSIKHAARGY